MYNNLHYIKFKHFSLFKHLIMNSIEFKEKRKKVGLTQVQLAKEIGVARQTIINYENGEVIPESKSKLLDIVFNENYTVKKMIPISEKGVPYYDIDFTSSFLEVENNHTMLPTSYITHPFFLGCEMVVRNSGQSMAKVICHGDAVGLVKANNWIEFLPYGEIYAIVTNDGFRMIKVITQGSTDDTYTLISKPMDSKSHEFPPQQIKKKSILSIFKVQASSHLF